MNEITFEASDFRYATAEEILSALGNYPTLSNFGFSLPNEAELLFSENPDPNKVLRLNNLFWWDLCLLKKCGKLRNAYLCAAIQCTRGLTSNEMVRAKDLGLMKFQFDFYIETAYYYYFNVCENNLSNNKS
jgi:hypothetical protein